MPAVAGVSTAAWLAGNAVDGVRHFIPDAPKGIVMLAAIEERIDRELLGSPVQRLRLRVTVHGGFNARPWATNLRAVVL